MKILSFEAIGTHWVIDSPAIISDGKLASLSARLHHRIAVFDKIYSRFRDDSLVAQISRAKGAYEFPDDALELFALYHRLYEASAGKVTPLIGNLMSDAGYNASYSMKPADTLNPAPTWDSVMNYRHPILTTREPLILDFGAAGKGYLIDLIAQVLSDEGLKDYLIDAGGDMLQMNTGGEPARIGLEHPDYTDRAIGVVEINNQSICGSAGNRRAWAGIHHIIDPDTTKSVREVSAAWAVADSAALADGLATALFFCDPKALRQQFSFEYFVLHPNMTFERSAGLDAEIFIAT